jgi:hypothetical protein
VEDGVHVAVQVEDDVGVGESFMISTRSVCSSFAGLIAASAASAARRIVVTFSLASGSQIVADALGNRPERSSQLRLKFSRPTKS